MIDSLYEMTTCVTSSIYLIPRIRLLCDLVFCPQGQPQPLDNHCTFWVRIEDVNDNAPVFDSSSYSTSISESSTKAGARIYSVRAFDKDKGKNADIVYSLTENPGGFFNIDADSGIIKLAKTISGVSYWNL